MIPNKTKKMVDGQMVVDEGEGKGEVNVDAAPGPKPNVVFVGRNKNLAISKFQNGMNRAVKLPPVGEQFTVTEETINAGTENEKVVEKVVGVPFYLKEASQLTRTLGDLYKLFVDKGA